MPATRAAAYLDALVAVWRAALPGVAVSDGPPLSDDAYEQLVCVGWDLWALGDSDAAAEISQAWALGTGVAVDEELRLTCSVAVQSGDTDMSALRVAATALLTSLTAALYPGGEYAASALNVPGVSWARLESARLVQRQTAQGAAAGFVFVVHVVTEV
jgi:hypothetical protein